MTLDQLRQALNRHPFQPFTLVPDDGRSFTISGPESVAISRDGREVALYEDDGTQHCFATSHIVGVESREATGPGRGRIDGLRRLKHRRPFVPFRIVSADGEPILVTHPDAVAWGDSDNPRMILVLSCGQQHRLDPALISAFVTDEPDEGHHARAEAIRDLLKAQPFRPFVLTLKDGERPEVHDPESLFCPPGARTLHLFGRGGRLRIFDLTLVAKVEPVEPPGRHPEGGDE